MSRAQPTQVRNIGPINLRSLTGKALQREGIELMNALDAGSTPVGDYATLAKWQTQET